MTPPKISDDPAKVSMRVGGTSPSSSSAELLKTGVLDPATFNYSSFSSQIFII